MTDRKPGVWRGFLTYRCGAEMGDTREAAVRCSHSEERAYRAMRFATVIEDGAVMPLDAATERLVEAVRALQHANEDHISHDDTGFDYMLHLQSRENELWDALAAYDAVRKESQ